MWVKALTNIRGVGKEEIAKGVLFEIKDSVLLRDCLESGSVEKAARPQPAKAPAAHGAAPVSIEAVSILLSRLGAPKDRVSAMAHDIIAIVESPEAEALIYANACADLWGKAAENTEIPQSPLPVLPVQPDTDGAPSVSDEDEDIEAIKVRALAEAEASD